MLRNGFQSYFGHFWRFGRLTKCWTLDALFWVKVYHKYKKHTNAFPTILFLYISRCWKSEIWIFLERTGVAQSWRSMLEIWEMVGLNELELNFGGVKNNGFNDGLNKHRKSISWNLNKSFEILNNFGGSWNLSKS